MDKVRLNFDNEGLCEEGDVVFQDEPFCECCYRITKGRPLVSAVGTYWCVWCIDSILEIDEEDYKRLEAIDGAIVYDGEN